MSNETMKIKLKNFQKWKSKKITLEKGVTLLAGKSGDGKSTIPRAIHFCLYGGRRYKVAPNKVKDKKIKTSVEIKFKLEKETFTITRERPEKLTVEFEDEVYTGKEAQGWIDLRFGTEASWVSSSYLAQEKDNFFMGESNAKKKDLLTEIVFGKTNDSLDPDVILSGIKDYIDGLKEKNTRLNEIIKMRLSDLKKMAKNYEGIEEKGEVPSSKFTELKDSIEEYREKIKENNIELYDFQRYQECEERISKLSKEISKLEENDFFSIDIQKIEEKLKLEKSLKNFNEDILNYSVEVIYKNKSIYDFLFSKGMKENETAQDFSKRKDQEWKKYEEFVKYQEVEKENSIIRLKNEQKREEYEMRMMNYRKFEKKNAIEEKIRAIPLEKMDENDDFSSFKVLSKIDLFRLTLKELICPHCGMGVFLKGNVLEKGSLNGENEREEIYKKLEFLEEEAKRRKEVEKLRKESDKIDAIESTKPEEPVYIELIPNQKVPAIKKPEYLTIEFPTIEYPVFIRLFESIGKIELFKKRDEYKDVDVNVDIDAIKKLRAGYQKKVQELNSQKLILKGISLSTKSIEELENEQKDYKSKISKVEKKIKFFEKVNEYVEIENKVNKKKEEQKEIMQKIEDFKQLQSDIESIARDTIDDFIASINTTLQNICNELFERHIEVTLQTTKETKTTGKEVPTINLSILYDGVLYDSPNELSGGEKKRISLALLLSFMQSSPSLICILDEALPSMDDDLKKKAISIIMEYCKGKFVVNICHGISEGIHEKVINILDD